MTENRTVERAAAPLDELLDGLPCGFVSFEDDGTIVAMNTTLAQMLGYERSELEGRHVEMLLAVASRIFFQTHLYPLVRLHGRAEELFVLLRRKDGGDVGALLNATRRERDRRQVVDFAIMEVRERRKYEEALLRAKQAAEAARVEVEQRGRELQEANDQLEQQAIELEMQQEQLERAREAAEQANQAKSQFLAVMSHELRTPLNAIGGYAQLIELGVHGPISDGQRGALERLTKAQRHLLGLINDVLELSRIEAGKIEYALENISVGDVITSVMPMVEPQLAAAGLTSSASVPEDVIVRADREKTMQILINLLTNALKFTPSGGMVSVAVRVDQANRQVAVDVTDSGIGIPAAKLGSVFEPFVQVDTSQARRKKGAGLGLAISRDLARGMGGDLVAQSEEGRGSTFTLILPRVT